MTQRVTFPTTLGESAGVLATPEADERRPGVIVLQEYWGVNDHIQSIAKRWASENFVALAPDLYDGVIATTADQAKALMGKLDWAKAMQQIVGAVAYLHDHPRCNGKIAITGYCMGGALSFAAATQVMGLSAVVPFYGMPPSADWSKVSAPIQAHFAEHDDWATVDGAKKIQATLAELGKPMELHAYDAKHAFCNDTRPEVYEPAAAKLAWARAVAFVRERTSSRSHPPDNKAATDTPEGW